MHMIFYYSKAFENGQFSKMCFTFMFLNAIICSNKNYFVPQASQSSLSGRTELKFSLWFLRQKNACGMEIDMSYKIVVDSCCELPKELLQDVRFERVPLELSVGDYHIQDDENFEQKEFLEKVAAYPKCPKSSCPSPQKFMEAYCTEAEHVYCITLSSKLSGSYNSAVLGKTLYEEAKGAKQIHVIDSESASGGETQIALKLMELEEAGLSFEQIVKEIENYRDSIKTYFVLDNLETLRKNGRLTGVKALVASTLNIKPVMGADHGEIIQKSRTIGMKKALGKMAELAAEEVASSPAKRKLIITHCNAPERAEKVKNMILEKAAFGECLVMETRGVSSMYANDGGIIVTT